MRDLLFFNGQGDALNFIYNNELERFEGKLIFEENSSDTFKTEPVYVLEKIPAFEFGDPSLFLDKFQLFNEYDFSFVGNSNENTPVQLIEPVNISNNFFSKWIYGDNFDALYPIGTEIKFNAPIFEFTNLNKTFTVVKVKKNAIMIISLLDNNTFNNLYGTLINNPNSYTGVSISGINIIGVKNYKLPSANVFLLSSWNQNDFSSKVFLNQPLSVINNVNQGVYSVNNISYQDRVYYNYKTSTPLTTNDTLFIEVELKTDRPLIYSGGLNFNPNNTLDFLSPIPIYLKPGIQFQVSNSILNNGFLQVDNIPLFTNTITIFYATNSQVIFDNKIFQCLNAYTSSATSSITPLDSFYWGSPDYLPIVNNLNTEFLSSSELYLTSNFLYFSASYTQSSEATLKFAADKYQSDLQALNIDLFYEGTNLNANLIYPTQYAVVNFYSGTPSTNNITTQQNELEFVIGVDGVLESNIDKNTSLIKDYVITLTDIDSFGLQIIINGQLYDVELVSILNPNGSIDLIKSIDKTIKKWKNKWLVDLFRLGINIDTIYNGSGTSLYDNAIRLTTDYPNVPLDFEVLVGSTAEFFIDKKEITFYFIGNFIQIAINERSYLENFDTDINTTLNNWVATHGDFLNGLGIFPHVILNTLSFKVKQQDTDVNFNLINVGRVELPGDIFFQVRDKFKDNEGTIITANAVKNTNPLNGFLTTDFTVGQITNISNTDRVWTNTEYNVLYVDNSNLVLSYQGAFWGTTTASVTGSGFQANAFTNGFGAPDNVVVTGNFTVSSYTSSNTLFDIVWNYQVDNTILAGGGLLGVEILDGYTNTEWFNINSTLTASSILNNSKSDNYVYVSDNNTLYQIDPYQGTITNQIIFSNITTYTTNDNTGDIVLCDGINTYLLDNTLNINTTINLNITKILYSPLEGNYFAIDNTNTVLYRLDNNLNILSSINVSVVDIFYNEITGSIFGYGTNNVFYIAFNSVVVNTLSIPNTNSIINFAVNPTNGDTWVSTENNPNPNGLLCIVDGNGVLYYQSDIPSGYGSFVYNTFTEQFVLLAINSPQCFIYDIDTRTLLDTIPLPFIPTKGIYNNIRKTILFIESGTINYAELQSTIQSIFSVNNLTFVDVDNQFGTLDPNYSVLPYIVLNTREYIRRPRANFLSLGEAQKTLSIRWEEDQTPEFFLYDFSGSQLPTTGSLAYTGDKPLPLVHLNRLPNRDITKVKDTSVQQTIFDEIKYTLDYIDITQFNGDINLPEPIEIFVGYNSKNEGVHRSKLIITESTNVSFDILNPTLNEIKFIDNGNFGEIQLSANSIELFTNRGLKIGDNIQVFISDVSNLTGQYISFNNGKILKIREIYPRSIIVLYEEPNSKLVNESTLVVGTQLKVSIKTVEKTIAIIDYAGQTEIEDIRYKTVLNNEGKSIDPDDVFIFKDYDINEEGLDWTFLNKKRKEMLLVKNDIFNFVGSYKAIINAINYFGYNDLELYEYYRNIDPNSLYFDKLYKVEIPDIFNNQISGWTDIDYLRGIVPNETYEETNLFNLTYRITDPFGNNVLGYSVREAQIKLQGLKKWLNKKVIPLTHDILDITGRADFYQRVDVVTDSKTVKVLNEREQISQVVPIIEEAYLLPIISGSSVYNIHVNFTYSGTVSPDYYTLKIRTYQIFDEWNPFNNYNLGDKVRYFGNLYESVISDNRLNTPTEFSNVGIWDNATPYRQGDIVNFQDLIYVKTITATITGTVFSPPLNNSEWNDITRWKLDTLSPVQNYDIYKTDLSAFNFTLDSNIDPYVVFEVITDNGYGMIWNFRKSVEFRYDADSDSLITIF